MKSKSGLSTRYEQSYKSRDKGGGGGKDCMDWKKAESEVVFYKPKAGRNSINIIPYKVTSSNHPLVKDKTLAIGDLDYLMDLFIHRGVGPSEMDAVCPKKNYSKPCPICEEAEKFREKGMKKEFDDLKASRRCYYNIINTTDEEKGIQIFSVSHYLFEHELIEEARNANDGGEMVDFADIENGMTVEFRGTDASFGGREFLKFKSFAFKDRSEALDEDLIDSAISFDSLMTVLTYDQLNRLLFDGNTDEETEEAPKKTAKKKPDEDDDEEEQPVRKAKQNPSSEEAEEAPKKTSQKKPDNDNTPGAECPHGYKFGKDCDEYDECVRCKSYSRCAKAGTK